MMAEEQAAAPPSAEEQHEQAVKRLTHDARNVACAILIAFEVIEMEVELVGEAASIVQMGCQAVHDVLKKIEQLSQLALKTACP